MKNITLLFYLLLFLLFTLNSLAQDYIKVSFDTVSISQTKKSKDYIFPINISVDTVVVVNPENYRLSIKTDKEESTLSPSEFEFAYKETTLNKLSRNEKIFVTIKGDTLPDRNRTLIFDLKIYKGDSLVKMNNEGNNKRLTINIKPSKPKLKGYEYLGYVGTNFDLVEGIRTKDLFFAANILNIPERNIKKNVGFYLSLYGNRAISRTDSTGLIRLRSAPIDSLDNNMVRVIEQSGNALETLTTDNIGAYISPLFQWPFKRIEESNTRLYLAPSLEFVFRRTQLITSEINIKSRDTVVRPVFSQGFDDRERLPREFTASSQNFNEYSFNAGIGLFLVHETERISVRVHGSVGYASNYYGDFFSDNRNPTKIVQQNDVFFSGRAWITEPISGVTLQAEVTNSLFEPRPFFVATLSKAFDFKDLGSFFSPITAR